MAKVSLPGGKSAVVALTMREFRQMWSEGSIEKFKELGDPGADMSEAYPVMARMIRNWDCTDEAGNLLDPSKPESFDELEPGQFMALVRAVAAYIGGEDTEKN